MNPQDEIKVAEIVRVFREQMMLSQDKFAELITQSLANKNITRQAISNWENGTDAPKTDFLEDMLSVYPRTDWRFNFALQMLAVKSPTVWGPDGVVWRLPKAE